MTDRIVKRGRNKELLTTKKGGLSIRGFDGMVQGLGQKRTLPSKKVISGTMLRIASRAENSSLFEGCSGVGERTTCEVEEIIQKGHMLGLEFERRENEVRARVVELEEVDACRALQREGVEAL